MKRLLTEQSGFTFQLVSDVHLELMKPPYVTDLFESGADVLFLAGDIGQPLRYQDALKPWLVEVARHFKVVIYVPGNHEYYQKASGKHAHTMTEVNAALRQYETEINNLHVLNPGVVEIGNRIVIGATLWTYIPRAAEPAIHNALNDYRVIYATAPPPVTHKPLAPPSSLLPTPSTSYLPVKRKKQGLLTIDDTVRMHEDDLYFVTEQLKHAAQLKIPALLCTHHAPMLSGIAADKLRTLQNTAPLSNPVLHAYGTDLLYLFQDYGSGSGADHKRGNSTLEWALHGHTHFNHLTERHGTTVYSNARGYPSSKSSGNGEPFNRREIKEMK